MKLTSYEIPKGLSRFVNSSLVAVTGGFPQTSPNLSGCNGLDAEQIQNAQGHKRSFCRCSKDSSLGFDGFLNPKE